MALQIQFVKYLNSLINENIIVSRLVNQQVLNFNEFCEYLADGSTITAADVAAVMKQIEMRLPLVLALNAKVMCSPEGLSFRPTVSGSITQSQLKKKLEAKLQADPTADIDVNRELVLSDLTTSDLTASITIDLPKKWSERFQSKVEFKRVNKAIVETTDDTPSGGEGTNSSSGSNTNPSNGTNSETVTAPVISGNTSFSETTSVTMSAEAGAEIRYTTDGSTPTASSTLYASALTLSDTTTVKAIAIKNGVSSEVATKVFTKSSGGSGDDAE